MVAHVPMTFKTPCIDLLWMHSCVDEALEEHSCGLRSGDHSAILNLSPLCKARTWWYPSSAWQAACNMVEALSCIKHCGMPFPVRWISGIYLLSKMFSLDSIISGGMRKCVPKHICHHHFLCIFFLLWWVAVPIILRPVLHILLIYLLIYIKIGLAWKVHST
jgi:hypothetical protein